MRKKKNVLVKRPLKKETNVNVYFIFVILIGIFLTVWLVQKGLRYIPLAKDTPNIRSNTFDLFSSCSSTENYDSWGLNPPDLGAESNPEIVLAMRGWGETTGEMDLVTYGYPPGEPPDGKAPQLSTIVKNGVSFSRLYKVHKYNYDTHQASPSYEDYSPVSLLGLSASNGQGVYTPQSGYVLTKDGHTAMLIYATNSTVTLNWIGDDNAIVGYSMHIDGFCVDPSLVALYRQLHSEGRHKMPVLRPGQRIGTANGEVRVAVRDSGSWMDPRSKLDWWQTIVGNPPPTNEPTDAAPTNSKKKKPTATPIPPTKPPRKKKPTIIPTPSLVPNVTQVVNPTTGQVYVTVIQGNNQSNVSPYPSDYSGENTFIPTPTKESTFKVWGERVRGFWDQAFYNLQNFFTTIAP